MVAKDSKKGHNTLLCTVGAFPTSQLQLLTPSVIKHRAIPVELVIYHSIILGGKHVFLGGKHTLVSPPPPDKTLPSLTEDESTIILKATARLETD